MPDSISTGHPHSAPDRAASGGLLAALPKLVNCEEDEGQECRKECEGDGKAWKEIWREGDGRGLWKWEGLSWGSGAPEHMSISLPRPVNDAGVMTSSRFATRSRRCSRCPKCKKLTTAKQDIQSVVPDRATGRLGVAVAWERSEMQRIT